MPIIDANSDLKPVGLALLPLEVCVKAYRPEVFIVVTRSKKITIFTGILRKKKQDIGNHIKEIQQRFKATLPIGFACTPPLDVTYFNKFPLKIKQKGNTTKSGLLHSRLMIQFS